MTSTTKAIKHKADTLQALIDTRLDLRIQKAHQKRSEALAELQRLMPSFDTTACMSSHTAQPK